MRSTIAAIITVVCLGGAWSAPAFAQDTDTTISTAAPAPVDFDQRGSRAAAMGGASQIGIHIFGSVEMESLSASKSYTAVFGKSSFTGFGAGADVLRIWRHVFLRVSVSHISASGNRASVINGQAVSLSVPITMTMTPIEIGAGWRLESARGARGTQPATPYVGGGLLALRYTEVSADSLAGDNTSTTFTGYFLMGGLDLMVARKLSVSAEADYRSVPNALGAGGVSQSFGETNLGGMTLRVLFGFRR
jgi:opacity protein-like surface antigen